MTDCEIVGDEKFINLAKKEAQSFNNLAENGAVPTDLMQSDIDYWSGVVHHSICEYDSECDLNALMHQPGATPEEIEKIKQLEGNTNTVSYNIWDYLLPSAYADWEKVRVSYDMLAYINLGSCYYNNCYEEWNEFSQTGSTTIDHDSYGSPLEHVDSGYFMTFYGRICDNYTGSENIINTVETTPYLGQSLQTSLSDDDLQIDSCAVAYYSDVADHDWIVGILVDSEGSYYWVET